MNNWNSINSTRRKPNMVESLGWGCITLQTSRLSKNSQQEFTAASQSSCNLGFQTMLAYLSSTQGTFLLEEKCGGEIWLSCEYLARFLSERWHTLCLPRLPSTNGQLRAPAASTQHSDGKPSWQLTSLRGFFTRNASCSSQTARTLLCLIPIKTDAVAKNILKFGTVKASC